MSERQERGWVLFLCCFLGYFIWFNIKYLVFLFHFLLFLHCYISKDIILGRISQVDRRILQIDRRISEDITFLPWATFLRDFCSSPATYKPCSWCYKLPSSNLWSVFTVEFSFPGDNFIYTISLVYPFSVFMESTKLPSPIPCTLGTQSSGGIWFISYQITLVPWYSLPHGITKVVNYL